MLQYSGQGLLLDVIPAFAVMAVIVSYKTEENALIKYICRKIAAYWDFGSLIALSVTLLAAPAIASPTESSAGFSSESSTLLSKPKIDGFVDFTYTYNLNSPSSRRTVAHSFDRKTDAFLMNALQINFDGPKKDGISYHAELAFGTDPSFYKARGTNNPTEAGFPTLPSNASYTYDIQEMFLTYQSNLYPISVKVGKTEKLSGIESLESHKNSTITRGMIFGLAQPFTHLGVLVGYQNSEIYDAWIGVVNGWNVNTDNNKGKTLASKLGLNFGDNLKGDNSLYYGKEDGGRMRISFDSSWLVKPIAKTTVGFQLNLGREDGASITDKDSNGAADGGEAKWYGIGIHPKYQYTDRFALGARYEWFYDVDGARAVSPFFAGSLNGVTIQNLTLTPTFFLNPSVMFRLEYRYEWASRDGYEDSDGAVTKDTVSIFATELVYKF
ncbi:MAG: outer membrane beta-barrel protein [Elusimicrobia bacterium]|nr:outer membrane beta-barrel protein [Elusimicrobiota bacterium]